MESDSCNPEITRKQVRELLNQLVIKHYNLMNNYTKIKTPEITKYLDKVNNLISDINTNEQIKLQEKKMNTQFKYFGFFIAGFIAAVIIHSDKVTTFTNKHNLLNWIGV